MVNRAWLFGLVLMVPLIGLAVSEAIQARLNTQLRATLRTQHPEADPAALATITLDRVLRDDPSELGALRGTYRNLNLLSVAAVAAGGVGLLLLVGIHLAGRAARTSRELLLHVFKPGLYLTAVLLIVLVLVHAAIAMAALYYGESFLIERIHAKLILLIGIGALLGAVAMARSVFTLVRKAQTFVVGQPVTRQQAPVFWEAVETLAQRVGALAPEHVVVGLDPNFFVTEADVVCLTGKLSGRTLFCSLPLCRILSREEFSAVIGHELGHYKGRDTQFSEKFFPIYRGTTTAVASLQAAGGGGARAIALLPAMAVLRYFLESFSVAESGISRIRELAADQAGVAVTSAATAATALVKAHAFGGAWEAIQNGAVNALREGKALINASKTYAELVSANAKPEVLNGIAETHLSHHTDSHPPLAVRLEALGKSLEEVSVAALDVHPAQAALGLFPGAEETEQNLSETYQAILARQLRIAPKPNRTAVPAECG
jgi:Zn-dependent protease with chaperone function